MIEKFRSISKRLGPSNVTRKHKNEKQGISVLADQGKLESINLG